MSATTVVDFRADAHLNWDDLDDRGPILGGPARLVERLGLDRLTKAPPVALFDELHKHPRWKALLKGLFDGYGDRLRILVTGSSRMDVYRRGGDSLMGRYFPYRMHPFSIAGTRHQDLPNTRRVVCAPRDWAGIEDVGDRAETFVACHLLKAVEGWTDLGLGRFQLAYLRDKLQREVDLVVIRDGQPWFLGSWSRSNSRATQIERARALWLVAERSELLPDLLRAAREDRGAGEPADPAALLARLAEQVQILFGCSASPVLFGRGRTA